MVFDYQILNREVARGLTPYIRLLDQIRIQHPRFPLLARARLDQYQTDKDRTNNRRRTIQEEETPVTPARSDTR
jgi:hypothetical protein